MKTICLVFLILKISKSLKVILHHSENKSWNLHYLSKLEMHSFFPGSLGLEEWAYWVCTVPSTQRSNTGNGTAVYWDLGAIAASQEELIGKLQVPCSLLRECCWFLNSYLMFSGGQIPAPTRAGGAPPHFVDEILPWIHSRATVKASLQPWGSKGKSIKPQLEVQNRGS